MAFVRCSYLDFCLNRKVSGKCASCIYFPYSRDPINVNNFVSSRCGSQSELCSHSHDPDYCDDCDPFDPPCSLFSCNISFND